MILNARYVPIYEQSDQEQVFAQEQSPRLATATPKADLDLQTSPEEAAAGSTKLAAEAETDGEVDPQEGGWAIREGINVKEEEWDEALTSKASADSRSLEPHHSPLSLSPLLVPDFLKRLLGTFKRG